MFSFTKTMLCTAAVVAIHSHAHAQFESAKQVYESPNMKQLIASHKTVAILPFKASISYKRLPKNYDAAATANEEKGLSTQMQDAMYTFLLRKADNYTATFQDVGRTNALLKRKGYMDRIEEVGYDSLCAALGVDAVIRCSYQYQRTASEGGAIAKSILLGTAAGGVANGGLTLQIYDKQDGSLVWRFYKEMTENVMSTANVMMERMMRKVSRNFPYEK